MTEGDYKELGTIIVLYGMALTIQAPRNVLAIITMMAINMVAGRFFIAHFEAAYIPCSALQCLCAAYLLLFWRRAVAYAHAALFAGMTIGGGVTAIGVLSHHTSIGLSLNYWTVMSVLTYMQFIAVMLYIFWQWQQNGLRHNRNRVSGN